MRVVVEPEHPARRVVDVLEPALLVDDEDALHHAREDGDHARAIARQLVDAASELLYGAVHRPRHFADLVVAVVGHRPPEVADRVTPRDRDDGGDPPLERRRQRGRDKECGDERAAKAEPGDCQQLRAMLARQRIGCRDSHKEQRQRGRAEDAQEDRDAVIRAHARTGSATLTVARSAMAGAGSTSL